MLVESVLVLVNAVALFVSRAMDVPGVDIMPAAVVAFGALGSPYLAWSIALLIPFFLLSATAIDASWTVLPSMLVAGFLASIGVAPMLALGLYYVISIGIGVYLGHIGHRYVLFVAVSAVLNVLVLGILNGLRVI